MQVKESQSELANPYKSRKRISQEKMDATSIKLVQQWSKERERERKKETFR